MKVTVRRRADRWQVDYTWPPHRPAEHPQGVCELRAGAESCTCGTARVRRSYATRKLADAAQAAIIAKQASGEFKGPVEMQTRAAVQTFGELCERWYSDPDRDDLSPATTDYYRKQLKAWRVALGEKYKPSGEPGEPGTFSGASRQLGAVSEDDVRRVVAAAWNRGSSPVRGNRLLTTARTLYRYAIKKGWATADPTAQLSKRTEPARGIEVTAEQEAAWLAECDELDRDLLTLYLRSASRLGDLLGDRYGKPPLDWTLVHLGGGCGCPSDRVTGAHLYLPHDRKRRTKERAARFVPLEADGLAALKRQHEAARLRGKGKVHGAVFMRDGEAVTAQAAYRRLKAAALRAGLPESIRIHDVRHTAISRMARSGAAFRDTMSVVGHRELSTHERYMHPTAAGARAAIESLTGTPLAQGSEKTGKKRG